jgi:hypothetical protein
MKHVRIRKINRGERVLMIPKEIAARLQTDYMSVKLDDFGRLIYTPVLEAV